MSTFHRWPVAVAAALFAALSVSTAAVAAPSAPPAAPAADPIAGSAHGAAWGPDGRPLQPGGELIEAALTVYLDQALRGAGPAQRARYEVRRRYLDDLARAPATPAERQSALLGRSLLLDALIDELKPADAARLKARSGLLKSWLLDGRGLAPGAAAYAPAAHELARFAEIGLGLPKPAAAAAAAPPAAVLQAREAYAKKCRKAGVPIPPTWGKAGVGWKSRGVLADPFISTTLDAELYEYQSASPAGLCLALPRYPRTPGSAATLLGIICMGTGIDTGGGKVVASACFWDNQLDKKGVPIARTGEFPLNTSFAAGDELDGGSGGTCTACHAGENAYIVHPDDAAFKGLANLKPNAWYTPIVADGWPKNPGPNTTLAGVALGAGDESCLDCHSAARKQRLPEITKGLATPAGENYCDAVLRTAIQVTMPPGGGALPDPAYKKHNDALLKACTDAAK